MNEKNNNIVTWARFFCMPLVGSRKSGATMGDKKTITRAIIKANECRIEWSEQ